MKKIIKIKVCGLREVQNIINISALSPDMIGFIFYEKSPRYVGNFIDQKLLKNIPRQIKKVGVFVNSELKDINNICDKYNLDIVQLHGDETPETCAKLNHKIEIIKAFRVDENFDFNVCEGFKPYCSLFLFDTKGEKYGGNSMRFDWEILQRYNGQTAFILSGGLAPENIDDIKKINHNKFEAIDINSRFETKPGHKDVNLVKTFLTKVRAK